MMGTFAHDHAEYASAIPSAVSPSRMTQSLRSMRSKSKKAKPSSGNNGLRLVESKVPENAENAYWLAVRLPAPNFPVVGSRCDGFYLPDCRNLVLSSLFSADGTVSPSMRRRELMKSAAAGLLVTTASDAAPILSTELKFPTDFAWGVSTSALQIEGSLRSEERRVGKECRTRMSQ